MSRILFLLLFIAGLFSSCQTGESSTDSSAETQEMEDAAKDMQLTADRLINASSNAQSKEIAESVNNMLASSMLESINFSNGELTLKYFDSASAYNQAYNQNRQDQTDESFKQYWIDGARAEKVITMVPAEVLKNFDFVQQVKINLPNGEKTISAVVTRDAISQFIGRPWKEIADNWEQVYTNTIVRIPEGRTNFMKEIVQQ